MKPQVVDAAYEGALKRFKHPSNLRDLMRGGFVPGVHTISKDVQNRAGWSEERCRFHGIECLPRKAPSCYSYRFYLRAEIEKHSTPEHTRCWLDHCEQLRVEKQRRHDEAEKPQAEFETRKAKGTLITRQEILAKGWKVPPQPDFVERFGRGGIRYYYRLPIAVIPVKRREAKKRA